MMATETPVAFDIVHQPEGSVTPNTVTPRRDAQSHTASCKTCGGRLDVRVLSRMEISKLRGEAVPIWIRLGAAICAVAGFFGALSAGSAGLLPMLALLGFVAAYLWKYYATPIPRVTIVGGRADTHEVR